MKKILILTLCLLSAATMAQELFPELAGIGGRTKAPEKKVEVQNNAVVEKPEEAIKPEVQAVEGEAFGAEDGLTEEDVKAATSPNESIEEDVDLFAASATKEEKKTEEKAEEDEEEEEEDEDEEQKITIYMKDADATITPNRNFSYCFGVIKVRSTLKKPVMALDVVLKYGNLTSNYNIRNLMPKDEQTGTITLMGTACERIMDMPEMTIKACQVEEMEEATCKKKVVFLPLRGE